MQTEFFSKKKLSLLPLYLLMLVSATIISFKDASAESMTGRITGRFSGKIDYEEPLEFDNGKVTGQWILDSEIPSFTVSGRFSSSGLSGEYRGDYDWSTQQITGQWKSAGDNEWTELTLDLVEESRLIFSTEIKGYTSGPAGRAAFSIKLEMQVQLQEKWADLSGKMSGSWSGTAKGSWSASVDTPLGPQNLSGSFSEPVKGIWNGQWNVGISSSGEIGGVFEAVFSGIAEVSVSTVIGEVKADIPVNGFCEGSIMLSSKGNIEFAGVWHELLETHDTSGTVNPDDINQGYGGRLDLVLKAEGSQLKVDGPATGGGKYDGTQVYSGVPVKVSYSFTGSFNGALDVK